MAGLGHSRSRSRSRSSSIELGNTPADIQRSELETWLKGLDNGKGALLQYLTPLHEEFCDLDTVAACRDSGFKNDGQTSVVNAVDPLLYDALGIKSLGHRLMIARGILKLAGETWKPTPPPPEASRPPGDWDDPPMQAPPPPQQATSQCPEPPPPPPRPRNSTTPPTMPFIHAAQQQANTAAADRTKQPQPPVPDRMPFIDAARQSNNAASSQTQAQSMGFTSQRAAFFEAAKQWTASAPTQSAASTTQKHRKKSTVKVETRDLSLETRLSSALWGGRQKDDVTAQLVELIRTNGLSDATGGERMRQVFGDPGSREALTLEITVNGQKHEVAEQKTLNLRTIFMLKLPPEEVS